MKSRSKRPKAWTFASRSKCAHMPVLGNPRNTLLRGPLRPGGGFVLNDQGFLVLHVWGVHKTVEFGNQATIIGDYPFWMALFRTLRLVVLSPAVRRACTGRSEEPTMTPDGLLRLPDGSTLDTKEPLVRMAFEEYRLWLENNKHIVPGLRDFKIDFTSLDWDKISTPSRANRTRARTHIQPVRRTYGKNPRRKRLLRDTGSPTI